MAGKNEMSGQSIKAYQLGKSASEWQHGANTKSDGADTNRQAQPVRKLTKDAKSIIIYFSRSGSTELLARQVAKRTHADVLEIVVKRPYAANYQQTLSRANSERENDNYPELQMRVPSLKQYQTVYLGYPIWAMTLAHPMVTFLTQYGAQLSHKRIAPFLTEGGYGQGDSVDRIKTLLQTSGATDDYFTPALVVDGNRADHAEQRVAEWVRRVTE